MSTRMIPLDVVTAHLDDKTWEDTVGDGENIAGEYERYWGIFEFGGNLYRTRLGLDPDPEARFLGFVSLLDVARGDTEVECEEVEAVPVTTYEYRPLA